MLSTAPFPSPAHPAIGARVRWDVTLACDRACADCPLGTSRWRDPRELSTIEAMLWMNRLRARGCRSLTLAGGDPVRRPDLEDLVRHAIRLGIEPDVVLAGGADAPEERLAALREAGLASVTVRRCAKGDRSAEVVQAACEVGLTAEIVDESPSCRAIAFSPTGEPRGVVPA